MTMDLEPRPGHWHFVLGPVEKFFVGLTATAVVAVIWWVVSSVQLLLTQQAVTNERLKTVTEQTAGVPDLATRVTSLEYGLNRMREDVREIKQGGSY